MWLKGIGIKRETEWFILAAHEQAIRANVIKAKIDNTQKEIKCRICGNEVQTVSFHFHLNLFIQGENSV